MLIQGNNNNNNKMSAGWERRNSEEARFTKQQTLKRYGWSWGGVEDPNSHNHRYCYCYYCYFRFWQSAHWKSTSIAYNHTLKSFVCTDLFFSASLRFRAWISDFCEYVVESIHHTSANENANIHTSEWMSNSNNSGICGKCKSFGMNFSEFFTNWWINAAFARTLRIQIG